MTHSSRITRRAALGALAAPFLVSAKEQDGAAEKPLIVVVRGHSDKTAKSSGDPGAVLENPITHEVIARERDISDLHVEAFRKLAEAAGFRVEVKKENPDLYETEEEARKANRHPKDIAFYELAKDAEKLNPDFVLYFHINANGNNPHARGTEIYATTHQANEASLDFVRKAKRAFGDETPQMHNYPGIQMSTFVSPGRDPVVALVEFEYLNQQNLASLTDPHAIDERCGKLLAAVQQFTAERKTQASLNR